MTVFLLPLVAKLIYKINKFRLEPAEIYPEVNSTPKNIICITLVVKRGLATTVID